MTKKQVLTKNKKKTPVDNVSKSKSKKRNAETIINDNEEERYKKLKDDDLNDVEDDNANNSDEETKLDFSSDDDGEELKKKEYTDDDMKAVEDGIGDYLEKVKAKKVNHEEVNNENGIANSMKEVSSSNINTVTSVLEPVSQDSIKDTNQVESTGSSLVPPAKPSSSKIRSVTSVLQPRSPDSINKEDSSPQVESSLLVKVHPTPGKNLANYLTLAAVPFQINTPKETISGFNSKSKQAMLDTLKPAQQMILRGLARTKIFQQIKFIGAEKLLMNSNIMENMYKNINVTDHNEKCKLHEALRHIVQRQLNSRRSYCIDKIVGQMKAVFKAEKMFPLEIIDKFYDDSIPEEARAPWYIFVYKFVVCVNGELLKAVSSAQAKEQRNIFNYITISDEAFARWVLETKYLKVKAEVASGESTKKAFQKPSGAHDSNRYSSRYNEIHKLVREGRSKSKNKWNHLFWKYFKLQHKILFQEKATITYESMAAAKRDEKPEEDEVYKQIETPVEVTQPFDIPGLNEEEVIKAIGV